MFFLLRAAFWLSLVVLLIPADPAETPANGAARTVSTFEAIGAAHSALRDAEGFCERNPAACDTGRVALEGFGAKARTGARWVHDRLDGDKAEAAPMRTPSGADEPRVAARAPVEAASPARPTPMTVPLPQARPIS
mgnify:CR=1 FL=1